MRLLRDINSLPMLCAPVVTVGSFDGVHRGHLHLLAELRARASETGGETVVVTFARHPRELLEPSHEMMLLTSSEEKYRLIAEAGIDNLVVMPFDETVAAMSAEEFVRDILVGRLGVCDLVVGYNHRLGRDRQGDIEVLRSLGEKYGFRVHRATRLSDDPDGSRLGSGSGSGSDSGFGAGKAGGKISSTMIREAISHGDLQAAERMLGRKVARD